MYITPMAVLQNMSHCVAKTSQLHRTGVDCEQPSCVENQCESPSWLNRPVIVALRDLLKRLASGPTLDPIVDFIADTI